MHHWCLPVCWAVVPVLVAVHVEVLRRDAVGAVGALVVAATEHQDSDNFEAVVLGAEQPVLRHAVAVAVAVEASLVVLPVVVAVGDTLLLALPPWAVVLSAWGALPLALQQHLPLAVASTFCPHPIASCAQPLPVSCKHSPTTPDGIPVLVPRHGPNLESWPGAYPR